MSEHIGPVAKPDPGRPAQASQGWTRERALVSQRDFWRLMTFILGAVLFLLLAGVVILGVLGSPGNRLKQKVAEWKPATKPTSPGESIEFDDLEEACGDLSSLPNYLCLANKGSEPVAGGGRLVIRGGPAEFTFRSTHHNSISIDVTADKNRYSLTFGPPQGKALIPGLYTGAMEWPQPEKSEESFPSFQISIASSFCTHKEARFRILEHKLSDTGETRKLVADFEALCIGGTGPVSGRISAVQKPRDDPFSSRN